jgi:hypothetical protein
MPTHRRQVNGRGPIHKLAESQQRKLLDGLNYLNLGELKAFCRQHSIPYAIAIEARDGTRRRTGSDDRKGVMLRRLRHFLTTGAILEETCFPAAVVCLDPPLKRPTASDRLFFGQYDKTNRPMVALLQNLTAGRFRHGAVARMLAIEFWTTGEAPTFEAFASAWLEAVRERSKPNAEWAFLSDRASRGATPGWKALRARTASNVLKTLNRICGA